MARPPPPSGRATRCIEREAVCRPRECSGRCICWVSLLRVFWLFGTLWALRTARNYLPTGTIVPTIHRLVFFFQHRVLTSPTVVPILLPMATQQPPPIRRPRKIRPLRPQLPRRKTGAFPDACHRPGHCTALHILCPPPPVSRRSRSNSDGKRSLFREVPRAQTCRSVLYQPLSPF